MFTEFNPIYLVAEVDWLFRGAFINLETHCCLTHMGDDISADRLNTFVRSVEVASSDTQSYFFSCEPKEQNSKSTKILLSQTQRITQDSW